MSKINISNKHKYSISGKEINTTKARKRHRSTEEQQERKKGRRHPYTNENLDSEDSDTLTDIEEQYPDRNLNSVTDLRERLDLQETENTEEMDEAKFVAFFASALKNNEIRNLMANTFVKTIDAKIKPIQESIDKVKLENVERDDKMCKLEGRCNALETQVDEYEQSKRDKNIIISGLEDAKCNQDGALEFLKTIPGVNITIFDLDYTLKLRAPPNNKAKVNRLRVALQNKEKKLEIMKAKKNLAKSVKMWINDDLTAFRARLGYQARQCVKTGKLEQTWTHDSKVFIKRQGEMSGRLVRTQKDLPDAVEK